MKVSPTPKERLPKIRSWKHNPNPPPPRAGDAESHLAMFWIPV